MKNQYQSDSGIAKEVAKRDNYRIYLERLKDMIVSLEEKLKEQGLKIENNEWYITSRMQPEKGLDVYLQISSEKNVDEHLMKNKLPWINPDLHFERMITENTFLAVLKLR